MKGQKILINEFGNYNWYFAFHSILNVKEFSISDSETWNSLSSCFKGSSSSIFPDSIFAYPCCL